MKCSRCAVEHDHCIVVVMLKEPTVTGGWVSICATCASMLAQFLELYLPELPENEQVKP